jgi:ATP-dependent DNA helicase RecQ
VPVPIPAVPPRPLERSRTSRELPHGERVAESARTMNVAAAEAHVAYAPAGSKNRPVSSRASPSLVASLSLEKTALEKTGLEQVLRARFGLSEFRRWQEEAIEAVLGEPGRALVVAPTGGGKSLTYQLPAVVLADRASGGGRAATTIVLSPLVALMEDQVRALTARGIAATFLASTLDYEERRTREAGLVQGRYALVYLAPERLASDAFVALLERCAIELVAIDEAHCIAQWGHDFRPDYLRIGDLLRRLRPKRVLACTATATPGVRAEIAAQLGFSAGGYKEILRGFARPNLHLAAQSVEGPKEARRALFELLGSALGAPRSPRGGAIVYAATRRATEEVTVLLRERGWNARAYHAGMDADVRTSVANAFAANELNVVVATNAFGMGIDRGDIRAVVHVQPPASIESYYQEVGRAGRDGDEAHGLLLCSGADIALRRRLAQLGTDGASASPEQAARSWTLFRELLRYLDARTCRHDFVLRYFGDEREILGGCGHCDVCALLDERGDDEKGSGDEPEAAVALVVRKALSGVARAQKRAGLQAIADMLHGDGGERTRRFGFDALSTFGLLSGHDRDWIVALLRALLAAGWIDLTPTEHPVPFVTRTGGEVMRAAIPARIILPAVERAKRRSASSARDAGASSRSRDGRKREEGPALDEANRPLFERLREHRGELARSRRVPAYVIALDRSLVELATHRPRSLEALARIYGFGPNRIEQYGQSFLDLLAQAVGVGDAGVGGEGIVEGMGA